MLVVDEDVLTFDDLEAPKTSSALVPLVDQPPAVLPTIVLDDVVPFPGAVVPLLLEHSGRRDAIHYAKQHGGMVLLINRKPEPERHPHEALTDAQTKVVEHLVRAQGQETREGVQEEGPAIEPLFIGKTVPPKTKKSDRPTEVHELHQVGVVARLMRVVRMPDDRLSALLQVFRRAQPEAIAEREPTLLMRVRYPAEPLAQSSKSFQALLRQVRLNLQSFFEAHPSISDDLKVAALGLEAPSVVADFVGQHLSRDAEERLEFLAELSLGVRMRRALEITIRELDLLTVGNRISQEIRDKVEKHQRDFLLREQLKSIRAELGEEKDPAVLAVEELRERLQAAKLPEATAQRANEELRRLGMLPTESPEHNTIRSYLEWIASLPWSTGTDETHDIRGARAILDEDHFGLDEVKDRIIEFLAVHQLNPGKVGTLMCFAGPPGVGKTSLGQSIARALGRKFYRFSVGGMRDEAEIKGHRRTYIGAMPGRILQGLKATGVNNPVFMLDELDKMGADWRGDPSSALLEVLDPAQNKSFTDHYLDLPFDLSKVMFIATVNVHAELPGPLRDRLEIIDLPGYIHEEKLEIARRYLLPRQRIEHGLKRGQLALGAPALARMITSYTHEAGVRELERMVAKVCRKRALAVVTKKKFPSTVTKESIAKYLGPPKNGDDRLKDKHKPGVAVGLAWTAVGGEVLFIEAAAMPGNGAMKVTGQLGGVMEESAKLALSYVKHRGLGLGFEPKWFDSHDIHLHFPAGAVKKDGPSAGITVTAALVSLVTGRPLTGSLAMTGEMTLRGDVLPVGGIREKVVAARRAGIRTVLVPERNRADVSEIPSYVREKLRFVFARDFSDVMRAAFAAHGRARAKRTHAIKPTAASTTLGPRPKRRGVPRASLGKNS